MVIAATPLGIGRSCLRASYEMAKDAKAAPREKADPAPSNLNSEPAVSDAPAQNRQQFPVLLPSTVINLAVHSLLMITVPFVLFFATTYGALDCK